MYRSKAMQKIEIEIMSFPCHTIIEIEILI